MTSDSGPASRAVRPGRGSGRNVDQETEQRQPLVEIQFRNEDRKLDPESHDNGLKDPGKQPVPEMVQALRPGQHPENAENGGIGKEERRTGHLGRGEQDCHNHDGAQQMNAGPRPVQDPPFCEKESEERGADYRLVHAAEGRVKEQDDSIKQETDTLAQVQQAEKQAEHADQDADMETADGQDMCDAQV